MKTFTYLAVLAGLFTAQASANEPAPEADPAPVEVMVLGTYHFSNPGQDVVNMEVDDFLAPRRQQEIAILVNALAEWQPTKVGVEDEVSDADLAVADYDQTEELLTTTRNESVQVGYRLARMLGHANVYGFDERGGEGEPDYFPLGKVQTFAEAHGGMDLLNSLFAEVGAMVEEEQAQLPTITVAQSLLRDNDPERLAAIHDKIYYSMLTIGDHNQQPGAELNAYWYMRNAKMFAKVGLFAEPGDRVLLIVGSGHATWIRHFVERTPGFRLVEAMPYLESAVAQSEALAD